MTEHSLRRPAKLSACPRCGKYTITATTSGLNISTDPEPLSIDQEIAALLTGQQTYDVQAVGFRFYLEWRCLTRIRAGRSYPVVAIHQCTPIDPRPAPQPDIELSATPREFFPDDPPF